MAPLLSRLFGRIATRTARNAEDNGDEAARGSCPHHAMDSRQRAAERTSSPRHSPSHAARWSSPHFESRSQVRVLVFRECDHWGRKVLYDSKSVQKTTASAATEKTAHRRGFDGYREVADDGIVYQYLRPCSDIKMLGEMIFGSVAMAYHGTMTKVHTIRSPPQLMISLVYPTHQEWTKKSAHGHADPPTMQNSTSEILIASQQSSSARQDDHLAHSVPVDVPSRSFRDDDSSTTAASVGSLCSAASNGSLASFLAEGSTCSSAGTMGSSYPSLHRRWLRNLHTSMETGMRQGCNGINGGTPTGPRRRIKIGLAAIISLDGRHERDDRFVQDFFFSHVALIEGHVHRMKDVVARALLDRRHFAHTVHKGVEHLQASLQDLLTAPRFVSPAWLNVTCPGADHRSESAKFMREFSSLVKEMDTKQANFFVSTLLTSVLTYHLSWVPTVVPPDVLRQHTYHKRHSAPWVEQLARSHPYNPLWMQLSDLCGAVGPPNRLVKIVVVGRKADVLLRILYLISYFVRCSDVAERNLERDLASRKAEEVQPSDMCELNARFESPCGSPSNRHRTSPRRSTCPCRNNPSQQRPEASNVAEEDQNDSLGYGSIGDAEDDPSCRKHIEVSKLYMQAYTRLRFGEADADEKTGKLVAPSMSDEDGYHSMEDPLRGSEDCMRCCGSLPGTVEFRFPRSRTSDTPARALGACEGFGWSLQAGLSDHYMSDFCMQAVLGTVDDGHIRDDLVASVQASVLGEPLKEAAAIVADVDRRRVRLVSTRCDGSDCVPQVMSPLVSSLCESVFQMHALKVPPEFCLMHLEDKLQEVYLRSRSLARCLMEDTPSPNAEKAALRLGVSSSDLPLLLSVATTHCPHLDLSLMADAV